MDFTKKVEEGINSVIMVLNEESITEVLEAISFLTVAYQFGVPNAEKGVTEMLRLVFRKEPAVKDAVNSAYNDLYLVVPDKSTKREKAIEVREILLSVIYLLVLDISLASYFVNSIIMF